MQICPFLLVNVSVFKGCVVRWSWLIYILVRLLTFIIMWYIPIWVLCLNIYSVWYHYCCPRILLDSIDRVYFFCPFINLSIYKKYRFFLGEPYKQGIDLYRWIFKIQYDNLCLLICKFNPFLYIKLLICLNSFLPSSFVFSIYGILLCFLSPFLLYVDKIFYL